MKIIFNSLFFIFLQFGVFSQRHFSNLYSPIAVSIPMLEKKGDFKSSFGRQKMEDSTIVWHTQMAWSPVQNLGLMANYSLANEQEGDLVKLNQQRVELGLGYYSLIYFDNKRNYYHFEFYGGGGYGRSREWHFVNQLLFPGDFMLTRIYDKFDGQYAHGFLQLNNGFALRSSKGKLALDISIFARLTRVDFFQLNHISDKRALSFTQPVLTTLQAGPMLRFGHENLRLVLQLSSVTVYGEKSFLLYKAFANSENNEKDKYLFLGLEYAFGGKGKP